MVTKLTASLLQKGAITFSVAASSLVFSQSKDSIREKTILPIQIYKKDFKEILPAQILSGEQLERLNSQSVADALRYFSGVQIKDYGGMGGLKTVNIRSMGSQHVGVFYDGIQLGNAQNGVVDLGKFSLDDMESISLYNGQKSEIFQPAKDFGSSGSIYLQPKTPVFKENQKTNVAVKLKLGSISLFNPSFRVEQKISDKVSASFSSEFVQSRGLYKFKYQKKNADGSVANDTVARRYDSYIRAKRFETGFNGTINDGSWSVRGYGYISDRGIPTAITNNNFKPKGQQMLDENYFIQANFRKKLFPKLETQVKAKFAYDYSRFMDTVNVATTALRIDNTYIQRELYFSNSNMYSITKDWDVSASFDFQYNNLDASLRDFSFPTRYTSLLAFATTYQWRKFKFLGSVLGTFVHENVEKNAKSPDKTEWTPSAFLSYQPFDSKDVTVRAFYKRIFRMPTFNDLYYTMIGNVMLKPEYTNQYDLGFTYQKLYDHKVFKGIYLKVDGYYNEVEDKIIAVPTNNLFRWMMTNLGKVRILGADVNVQAELDINKVKLKPLVSYTYQRAGDYTNKKEDYYGDQISYVPWHTLTFTMMADYKDWSFNYSFMYTGERYDAQLNNIRANYLQPWYTHDLSVQKKFNWHSHQIKAGLEVNNVLDQHYDVVRNYPMPGRNFKLIVSFTL
ncbi:MAG: TonB-dependent receptor [Chryseobacterium sp.]|jgi:outer membrane cobalamin receptor|uniref:TonB-dependent receptor plug domain-containing protein n=1 Tax=Chryseobacterium sp. TaxID=1871047 RepID=UPI00282410CD|nr:TonB-dependent receptor [Chryseobacterium sp.]MDR2235951.1 TonB-dependent receptor [Chryseobacterium sp.]